GQLLEEGIMEAGALSSWAAAATSYSVHGLALLPFYIYYSIFGFQRVGDLIWAAADQRARGFLIGATAGRTTLSGEGLQHQDGSSHVIAAAVPNCRAYDPAFAYEMAVILDHGARSMMEEGKDEFYYVTAMNESYAQPSAPAGVEADIIKGLYLFASRRPGKSAGLVRLLGSGAILPEVVEAAGMLEREWSVSSEVWSATSYSELARDARDAERRNRLNPRAEPIVSHLAACLPGDAPIVAASDYVRAYPQLIASYVEARFTALGTDGFGRSDTRAALRAFFEVDRRHIVVASLAALASHGAIARETVAEAIARYGGPVDPLTRVVFYGVAGAPRGPLLREAGKAPEGRMGCGKQGSLAASSRRRSCNPTRVEAAGHTPSGAIARRKTGVFDALWRHLPQ